MSYGQSTINDQRPITNNQSSIITCYDELRIREWKAQENAMSRSPVGSWGDLSREFAAVPNDLSREFVSTHKRSLSGVQDSRELSLPGVRGLT